MTIPVDFPLEREAYVPSKTASGSLARSSEFHSSGPIIDFRCRPPTREVLAMFSTPVWREMGKWLSPQLSEIAIDEYVADLQSVGIWKGVFSGRDIARTFDYKLTSEHVASVCNEFPDFFIGVGGVDPNAGGAAVDEVKKAAALGLRGISIDPYFQKLPADHPLYYPVFTACIENGLFLMVTTGPAARISDVLIEHSHPSLIDRIARDLPELRIVVSHGGYPWPAEMVAIANKQPNVYFEWAAYETQPLSQIYVEGANSLVPDKVLFAGLSPFTPIRETLETYRTLGLTDDAWSRMSFTNPHRLLSEMGVFDHEIPTTVDDQ